MPSDPDGKNTQAERALWEVQAPPGSAPGEDVWVGMGGGSLRSKLAGAGRGDGIRLQNEHSGLPV